MLPYLQGYNDPKIEKAYRLYIGGLSQRKILKKVKGLPQRSLARYCKNDGWEEERRARAVGAADAPNVAAVAAGVAAEVAADAHEPAPADPAAAKSAPESAKSEGVAESRNVRMDRMLERQQRVAGRLVQAYERDVDKTLSDADTTGKTLSRSQIAQLATLGNNLLTMERKAWCVPDKIETKDTTPSPAERVRNLPNEELRSRLEAARRKRDEAERRGRAAAAGGGPPAQSVM